MAKLRGIPENTSNQNVLLSKPAKPNPLQEKDLLDQLQAEVELEKSMPDQDEELEIRLAKLKGVDVEAVRHPGRGLDKKPSVKAKSSTGQDIDPVSFLHDHSDYSAKPAEKADDDGDLMNDISTLNKEVSYIKHKNQIFSIKIEDENEENMISRKPIKLPIRKSLNKTKIVKDKIVKDKIVKDREGKFDYSHLLEPNGSLNPYLDNGLSCTICHHAFLEKRKVIEHQEQHCRNTWCAWKEEEHEHKWLLIAFPKYEDALNYLIDEFDIKNTFCVHKTQYWCKLKTHLGCKAEIRIRKSKRYINDFVQIPVFEIGCCIYHNHKVEAYPCLHDHEHVPVDQVFDNEETAEELVKELLKEHGYRRQDSEDPKVLKVRYSCNVKGCKAFFQVFPSRLNQVRVKGCLNHSGHIISKKVKSFGCPMEHEHQLIEMEFGSKEEFDVYFVNSELRDQFVSRHSDSGSKDEGKRAGKQYYRCKLDINLKPAKKGKLTKKIPVEKFDCPIQLVLIKPKTAGEKWIFRGCIQHTHEITKTRIPPKIRIEAFNIMSSMELPKLTQNRNFKRFREMVYEMRKKQGSNMILNEMTIEDLIFQPEMISFRPEFIDRVSCGDINVRACQNFQPGDKKYEKFLGARREIKRKKLLEQLTMLKEKLENLEHNEENERFLDKTESAFKEIPGVTEEYFARKRAKNDGQEVFQTNDIVNGQPVPKRRKVAKKRNQQNYQTHQTPIPNQNVEYFISPEEQTQAVQHIISGDLIPGYQITFE